MYINHAAAPYHKRQREQGQADECNKVDPTKTRTGRLDKLTVPHLNKQMHAVYGTRTFITFFILVINQLDAQNFVLQ